MRASGFLIALALVAGCTKATTANETPTNNRDPGVMKPPDPKTSVALTSVTFADDCGGTAPFAAPLVPAPANRKAPATRVDSVPASEAPASQAYAVQAGGDSAQRRRCEQTSMQLSIIGANATDVHIKSVEVLDDGGKSLGVLTASKPTKWSTTNSAYEAWDEKVASGDAIAVSYVLSQPTFVDRWDSRDRTYTVKVVASVGGADQPLTSTVLVVAQPPAVPT